MTWPTEIDNPYDIPHMAGTEHVFESLTVESRKALCQLAAEIGKTGIELVTGNDPVKERFYGSALLYGFHKGVIQGEKQERNLITQQVKNGVFRP